MSRDRQRRLALRAAGRRRAAVASGSAAVAGTALAAVFGVALAHNGVAAAKSPHAAPVVLPRPAVTTTVTTAPGPATHATTRTQALRPPTHPPVTAQGGGGAAGSGGS